MTDTIQPIPLIFDDDGSQDGMTALAYMLANPKFDVQAITIANGIARPEIFDENVKRMLGRLRATNIPVGIGRSTPLEGNNEFPDFIRDSSDTFWFPFVDLPEEVPDIKSQSAVDLIIDTVNNSPEPVAILATGPLTNIAEALRQDPSIIDRISVVQIMGGAIFVEGNLPVLPDPPFSTNTTAEFNIWVDPIAAQEVFEAGEQGLNIQLTPLDATNQIKFDRDDYTQWLETATPESEIAAEFLDFALEVIQSDNDPNPVWDLVAAINLSEPDFSPETLLHIDVDTESDPGDTQGQTVAIEGLPPNVLVSLNPSFDNITFDTGETFSYLELPVVSLSANRTVITEGGEAQLLSFHLSEPAPAGGLVVNINIDDPDGESDPGDTEFPPELITNIVDFGQVEEDGIITASLTIAEGATEATFGIAAFEDDKVETGETYSLTLLDDETYIVAPNSTTITTTIEDNMTLPTVSITPEILIATEGETFAWNFSLDAPAPEGGLSLFLPITVNNDPAPGDVDYNVEGSSNISEFEFVTTNNELISQIYAFGDSYSDDGLSLEISTDAVNAGVPGSFVLPADPELGLYDPEGRWTNGETAVEVLSQNLGVDLTNYAVGGAKSGNGNYYSWLDSFQDTGVFGQIDQFASESGETADPDALYFIFASANDFFEYADFGLPGTIEELATQTVDNIVDSVSELSELGAEKFLVVNSSDLDILPGVIEFGQAEQAELFVDEVNSLLSLELATLDEELDIDIALYDHVAISDEIRLLPEEYGLTNIDDPYQPVFPVESPSPGENPDEYYFWDEYHPTRRAHEIIGEDMAGFVNSEFNNEVSIGFNLTIAEGATEATLVSEAVVDDITETDETFTTVIADGVNYVANPELNSVTTTITELPVVSFVTTEVTAAEGERFTWDFSLNQPAPEGGLTLFLPVTANNDPAPGDVDYNINGTSNISEFEFVVEDGVSIGFNLTIAEGATEASLVSEVVSDDVAEETEIATIVIADGVNYRANPAQNQVVTTLTKNDTSTGELPTISVVAEPTEVEEGEQLLWNFSLSEAVGEGGLTVALDLVEDTDPLPGDITYFVEGSENVTDFELIIDEESGLIDRALVTLAEGATETTLVNDIIADNATEGEESVSFALAESDEYSIDSEMNAASFTILDTSTEVMDVIDLTSFTVEVGATSNASFTNIGGFYQAIDTDGTVIDPMTGNEVSPGDEGYETAALASSVVQIGDGEDATLELDGGFVYVPYLLANGTRFFTTFEKANADGLDHVQSTEDSTFGFEDLLGGGDNDFNDYVISFDIV